MALGRFSAIMAVIPLVLLTADRAVGAMGKQAAGWRHSVVVEDGGTVRAWGDGRYGQLGNGNFDTGKVPAQVVGPGGKGVLNGIAAVSAGQHHTLALGEDGSVWAWGNNTFGQLGNGAWGMQRNSATPARVLGPGGQGFLEGAVAVAGGWDHSVAVLADGTVWAWGSRCQGQLGDGRRDANSWSTLPVPVAGPGGEGALSGIVAVACGAFHTVALRDDGALFSWGGNHEGQLGRGALADRMYRLRAQVPWTPRSAGRWSAALGYLYTNPSRRAAADRLEVTDEFDGPPLTVVADGADRRRQTARSRRRTDHVAMQATLDYPAQAEVGKAVVLDLKEILVGLHLRDDDFAEDIHLLLTNRDTGEQVRLDIGDGLALTLALPAPVVGPEGQGSLGGVHAIAAGVYHTVALGEDGRVWAWGYNATGQLGNGTRTGTGVPTPMVAGEKGGDFLGGIVAVAAGYESTYALDEGRRAWACGWNVYGQLGAAEEAHSAAGYPAVKQVRTGAEPAVPAEGLASIAAGAYHALAGTRAGALLAWGHNGFGQLGDGTVRDRAVAVPAAALAAGFQAAPQGRPARLAPPPPAVELRFAELAPDEPNVFNALKHGATGDGVHLDQPALQRAIDAAHEAGGGVVLLPPGTYRTGTLRLLSNVRLHLDQGATILGSTNRDHYQVGQSRPGVIVAQDAENIAITGKGVINGRGYFCPNRGWRHYLLGIYDSTGITIEGIATKNAGSWTQHYVNCRELIIRGVTVNSVRPRRNNDGIDLSGCRDVLIEGCIVASEDDAIVIKSQSADRVNRNIRAVNNTVYTMCNGFKLGTETRGDYETIACEDLRAFGGSTLAVWSVDGARVRGVEISKVRASDSRFALGICLGARLRASYFAEGERRVPGIMEGVTMRDIDIEMSDRSFRDVLIDHGIENAEIAHQLWARPAVASFISGLPGHKVRSVLLEDVRISYPGGGAAELADIKVPERATAYPNAGMFGPLPAWGLYLRDAEAVTLRRLRLELQSPDGRPALVNANLDEGELVIEKE